MVKAANGRIKRQHVVNVHAHNRTYQEIFNSLLTLITVLFSGIRLAITEDLSSNIFVYLILGTSSTIFQVPE